MLEAVCHFDTSFWPQAAATITVRLGWPVATVTSAMRAFARGGYVEDVPDLDGKGGQQVAGTSARAYRKASAWSTSLQRY